MNAISKVAVIGDSIHIRTSAKHSLVRVEIENMNHSVSGTSASAVKRCHHQWVDPSFADPSPITLASGVL